MKITGRYFNPGCLKIFLKPLRALFSNWNPLAQWASKFQSSRAPTETLVADVAASVEIRGQMRTKYAWTSSVTLFFKRAYVRVRTNQIVLAVSSLISKVAEIGMIINKVITSLYNLLIDTIHTVCVEFSD